MQRIVWVMLATAAVSSAQQRGTVPQRPRSLMQEMLASHNAVRARVRVGPLVWSGRLAAYAQEWADALLKSGRFAHRPHPVHGENLFEITGGSAPARDVVEAWAAELQDYDFSSNTCRGVCGHYTQIVWSTSTAVGCAVARAGRREVWVCNYDPPGNWVGRRPY